MAHVRIGTGRSGRHAEISILQLGRGEPSLGLAPLVVESVHQAIDRIRREMGIGGILVEQNVAVALTVAARYVLQALAEMGSAGGRGLAQPCRSPVTRQITSPTSSATRSEPSGPSVTPTGRP